MNYLTIVGFGPRGLYALECFLQQLSRKRTQSNLPIVIIEKQQELGVGSAWDTTQPDANWINISDRALQDLQARPEIKLSSVFIPGFPSFIKWTQQRLNHKVTDEKDVFFKRKVMGNYLNERATSLVDTLDGLEWFQLIPAEAIKLEIDKAIHKITTLKGDQIHSKKTLLTTGHLKTELSKQDVAFTEHAKNTKATFLRYPYSGEAYKSLDKASHVAVKGMGLSMIDVVQMVLYKQEGVFINNAASIFLKYQPKKELEIIVIPFSLDGLPPVPKPLGKNVDDKFAPTVEEKSILEKELRELIATPEHLQLNDLLSPITSLIAQVYSRIKSDHVDNAESLVLNWLTNESINDSNFLEESLPVISYMKETCLMASGKIVPSLDYTIGQIWRHLQPIMYPIFTHSSLEVSLQKRFIEVDEKTKRYSYGPPVERILQLIAMAEQGSLELNLVNNPKIEEVKDGWVLHTEDLKVKVNTMVNGVLASPNLAIINDDLINNLYDENLIHTFEKDLGISTDEYGRVKNESGNSKDIAALGRIAKGSVYGVDAILECFSPKVEKWAQKVIEY